MSNKPDKAASSDAPAKRSTLKLALLALAPLALASGGYAGWTLYAGASAEAAGEAHGADPVKVSAVPTEIAAETSFTHSYALSVLIARDCGAAKVEPLRAASEEEARADGLLVSLSWMAAVRRTGVLDQRNCSRLLNEVLDANAKAAALAEARAGSGKGAEH